MPELIHKPVLLRESIEALNIRPDGVYVDGTLGRAGHSIEIAQRLPRLASSTRYDCRLPRLGLQSKFSTRTPDFMVLVLFFTKNLLLTEWLNPP